MTAEQWNETIKWVQKTQNLWELGDNSQLFSYNYTPKKYGQRRTNLTHIEWHEVKN